jgi:hypothetical protein
MDPNVVCSQCGLTFRFPGNQPVVGLICPRCDGVLHELPAAPEDRPDPEDWVSMAGGLSTLCAAAVSLGLLLFILFMTMGPRIAAPVGMFCGGVILWGILRAAIRPLVSPAWAVVANVGTALFLTAALLLTVFTMFG